jgi:Uma2 family endonuclease
MGEPVRKMPADWETETAPNDDPFRYGSRWRRIVLPTGEVTEQQIPLTPEDLLDPELGDEVTQSGPHADIATQLFDLLKRHFETDDDVLVTFDMKILWGIPGLLEPSPDVAVVREISDKGAIRSVFNVPKEGVRPSLIIEVVSDSDAAIRRNDYEKKVDIYERAGIPEYLIVEPAFSSRNRVLLTGYRMAASGRYQKIQPDEKGRLLSTTTGLWFGVAPDRRSVHVIDAATGTRLLTSSEETAGRKAAEAELAQLRAELDRLKNS